MVAMTVSPCLTPLLGSNTSISPSSDRTFAFDGFMVIIICRIFFSGMPTLPIALSFWHYQTLVSSLDVVFVGQYHIYRVWR